MQSFTISHNVVIEIHVKKNKMESNNNNENCENEF